MEETRIVHPLSNSLLGLQHVAVNVYTDTGLTSHWLESIWCSTLCMFNKCIIDWTLISLGYFRARASYLPFANA
jgi:hypothetical protein